jgi:3-hydroxybutyryl-CoA dehydratase
VADCLHYEDLVPGAVWTSPARTLTESDIVHFAGMTGDFDPLHMDHEFAAQSPYGRPIAHGLLGLSLLAGLSSTCPRVKTLALVSLDQWQFHIPVFAGDTVHVVTQIESVRPSGRRSGQVVWFRKLINQRGECVQSGRLTTLVSSQSFLPRKPRMGSVQRGKLVPNIAKIDAVID